VGLLSWEKRKLNLAEEVCELIQSISALKFGFFTLTSGKKSPIYIDLRVIPSYPEVFERITEIYLEIIKNEVGSFDKVAGVPTAGLPIATLVSYKLKAPMIYVRKSAKAHGTRSMVEGVLNLDDRVLIVDDLVTTGSSIAETAKAVRLSGGIVEHAVVLIDREQGGIENLLKEGIRLHSLLNITFLLETLHRKNLISTMDYHRAMKYLSTEKAS